MMVHMLRHDWSKYVRAIRLAVLEKSHFKQKKTCLIFGGQILEVEEANCIIFFNKIIATQSTFATMMKFVCLLDGNIAFLRLTKNSDLPRRFPGYHERLP